MSLSSGHAMQLATATEHGRPSATATEHGYDMDEDPSPFEVFPELIHIGPCTFHWSQAEKLQPGVLRVLQTNLKVDFACLSPWSDCYANVLAIEPQRRPPRAGPALLKQYRAVSQLSRRRLMLQSTVHAKTLRLHYVATRLPSRTRLAFTSTTLTCSHCSMNSYRTGHITWPSASC